MTEPIDKTPCGMVLTGWMVHTTEGPFLLQPDKRDEACSYCEDGALPVPMYSRASDVDQHEKDQGL